jgi:hypothetical protein
MTAISFADLAQFGVVDRPIQDIQETIVHSMTAEEFLAHMGLNVPDEPSDQFYEDADKFFAHYGVMGMKWGRRRNSDGSVSVDKSKTAGNHPGQSDGDAAPKGGAGPKPAREPKPVKPKPPSAKEMTNEELNAVIKRLELEQRYTNLVSPKAPTFKSETKKILVEALKKNAQAYVTEYTGVAIGAVLQKAGVPNAKDIAANAKKATAEKSEEKKS